MQQIINFFLKNSRHKLKSQVDIDRATMLLIITLSGVIFTFLSIVYILIINQADRFAIDISPALIVFAVSLFLFYQGDILASGDVTTLGQTLFIIAKSYFNLTNQPTYNFMITEYYILLLLITFGAIFSRRIVSIINFILILIGSFIVFMAHEKALYEMMHDIAFLSYYNFAVAMILTFMISFLFTKYINADVIKEKMSEVDAKDQFFGIISHDLRSPFNSIIGYSEILLKKNEKADAKEREKYAKIILDNSKKTYNLLNNILEWAKTQSGALKVNKTQFNLNPIISEVIDIQAGNASSKNITINFRQKKDFTIYSDKEILKTILRNILSNAIKFTHENKKITIETKLVKHNIIVSIADQGIGMDENICQNLFDITKISSTKGTNNELGSGLGLILCKEFVEKQGGKIWVDSKKYAGSTFYFSIPTLPLAASCKLI